MSRRKEKGLANPGRRAFLKKTAGAALAAAASGLTGLSCGGRSSQPIKVGIMHSLSGTMAISETSLRDVELMAIE